MRHKKDCLAATATGPTVLSDSHPIMSPKFPIVASILDVKKAMQNSRVGATRIRRNLERASGGRLKLNSDARIRAKEQADRLREKLKRT